MKSNNLALKQSTTSTNNDQQQQTIKRKVNNNNTNSKRLGTKSKHAKQQQQQQTSKETKISKNSTSKSPILVAQTNQVSPSPGLTRTSDINHSNNNNNDNNNNNNDNNNNINKGNNKHAHRKGHAHTTKNPNQQKRHHRQKQQQQPTKKGSINEHSIEQFKSCVDEPEVDPIGTNIDVPQVMAQISTESKIQHWKTAITGLHDSTTTSTIFEDPDQFFESESPSTVQEQNATLDVHSSDQDVQKTSGAGATSGSSSEAKSSPKHRKKSSKKPPISCNGTSNCVCPALILYKEKVVRSTKSKPLYEIPAFNQPDVPETNAENTKGSSSDSSSDSTSSLKSTSGSKKMEAEAAGKLPQPEPSQTPAMMNSSFTFRTSIYPPELTKYSLTKGVNITDSRFRWSKAAITTKSPETRATSPDADPATEAAVEAVTEALANLGTRTQKTTTSNENLNKKKKFRYAMPGVFNKSKTPKTAKERSHSTSDDYTDTEDKSVSNR